MDSIDLQVLQTVSDWCAQGRRAALVTVVRTWGSAPRRPGAMLALRDDGRVVGSVSGGCVEDDLIRRSADVMQATQAQVLTYGVTQDEARRFGLPCGGTLQLVVEPVSPLQDGWVREALAAAKRSQICVRRLTLATATSEVRAGHRSDALSFDGHVLQTVHGPRWRLLLVGAGQASLCLAEMARALDYDVTVCDPRVEYTGHEWSVPGVALDRRYPDDAVLALEPDTHTAVVTLTHDPRLDDAALMEALKTPAFYVGALGSQASSLARRERLRLLDLSADEVARLHAPVGLPIGSRTPAEIAVSILAHLTAERHGRSDAAHRSLTTTACPPVSTTST